MRLCTSMGVVALLCGCGLARSDLELRPDLVVGDGPLRGEYEALILAAVRPVHLRKVAAERFEALGHRFGRDYLWFY